MLQSRTCIMGGTTIACPPLASGVFPVLITTPAYCTGGELRRISGGSLEIMPNLIAGGSVGGATVPGNGYLIGSSQVVSWDGPASFFLGGSGSTCVAAIRFNFSSGATLT